MELWAIILIAIIASFLTWLITKVLLNKPSELDEMEKERLRQELQKKLEEDLRRIKAERMLELENRMKEFEQNYNKVMIEHRDKMADLALKEACERNRVSGIFIELDTKINQKKDQISNLEERRAELSKVLDEYEKNLTTGKLRIIKNYKYKRDKELEELQATYDELTEETRIAIDLLKTRLAEWSNAERLAYEERMGREEAAKLNRLGISDLSVSEIVELHAACNKMRLANPVPLYKAIYEIYFRGPVKELGVKLNATGVCGIYKITNVNNGKVYVGQSVDIAERWKQHIKRGTKCETGTIAGAGLYEAMFNEGVWNFSFCILEECEKENLNAREKFWISHFQSNEIGYNKKL